MKNPSYCHDDNTPINKQPLSKAYLLVVNNTGKSRQVQILSEYPKTYKQAIQSAYSKEWQQAMEEEIKSLIKKWNMNSWISTSKTQHGQE